jgi:uncharacterized spore protein YtfJ
MNAGDLVKRATEGVSAGRAFGPAIERDDCLIIPAAWVITAGGGGGDFVDAPEGSDASAKSSGGGGFTGITWPLGVYVVKDGNVRWVPALDMTRLALGGLAIVRHLIKRRSRNHARAT